MEPVICFGQQPNGILPKKFFVAKLKKARELQDELGGKIVWFLHDSDHDYRETRTRIPSEEHPDGYVDFNFDFKNKVQRKWTPLARKSFNNEEMESIRTGLHHLTNDFTVSAFEKVNSMNLRYVSEFCVEMYKELGLLDGVKVISSFSPEFRRNSEIRDFGNEWFYDTEYENEMVRAEVFGDSLRVHHGGPKYSTIKEMEQAEMLEFPERISAGRDARFDWMQSSINCTHYVMGNSEAEYLKNVDIKNKPELVLRSQVDDSGLAWIPKGN